MSMKYRRIYTILALVLVSVFLVTACQPAAPAATAAPAAPAAANTSAPAAAKPFRVGLIVATGGLGDRSF